MKRVTFALIAILLGLSFNAFAQPADGGDRAAKPKFPGISPTHLMMLNEAKKAEPIPLPTWLPQGFRLEDVKLRLGSTVEIQDRVLLVVYSRKLADGAIQRFAIEAGFDGLGDLMYEPTRTVRSSFGRITLIYEPKDEDGAVQKGYVMTEWFDVGKTAYHYIGNYGFDEVDENIRNIPIEDTVRILGSLKRF